jgi:hypothetical protein
MPVQFLGYFSIPRADGKKTNSRLKKKPKIIVAKSRDFPYQCGQMHRDGAGANRFCPKKMHE